MSQAEADHAAPDVQQMWQQAIAMPRQCASFAPLAGRIKKTADDFVVEEIPAYLPCGTGDHLFLWLEKRDVPALQLTQDLARALGVHPHDIGTAGMKDTRAVTRQMVSVPASAEAQLEASGLDLPGITLLRKARHGNKLKTGHLQGNKFVVTVRDIVGEDAQARAETMLQRLQSHGLANYFGQQRFGNRGNTLRQGMAMLGVPAGGRAPSLRGSHKRLALSAVQSALFNVNLAKRVRDETLHTVVPGEVMQVCASGGPFVADDVEETQTRLLAREVVVAGPMFGGKMRAARDSALAAETSLLQSFGLSMASFDAHKKLLRGTRRANVVWLTDLQWQWVDADSLQLSFTLPPGSYATVLLAECFQELPRELPVAQQSTRLADDAGSDAADETQDAAAY